MSLVLESQWISVEDELPELNVVYRSGDEESRTSSYVLVTIDQAGEWQHNWQKQFHTGEVWYEVTHWQPLPSPPRRTALAKEGGDDRGN